MAVSIQWIMWRPRADGPLGMRIEWGSGSARAGHTDVVCVGVHLDLRVFGDAYTRGFLDFFSKHQAFAKFGIRLWFRPGARPWTRQRA